MTQRSVVSVQPANSYEEEVVLRAVRSALDDLGGITHFVKPGQRVLLKPNLLAAFAPEKAVTTHPAVVRAAALLVREARGRLIIGDSPGFGEMSAVMRRAGITSALEGIEYEAADFKNEVEFEQASNLVGRKLAIAKAAADADLIITLPKLKTHVQMTFTGALKNQYGLIVGAKKVHYHYRFKTREWLAAFMIDLNRLVRPSLAIMDAIVGMEGAGPSGGEPRAVGAIIASPDPTAADVVACSMIGLDPDFVPLIQAAKKAGYGAASLEKIENVGVPWQTVRVPDFKKVPEPISVLRVLPLPVPLLEWIRRQWAPRPKIIADRCIRCKACNLGCPLSPPAIDPLAAEAARQVDDERCIRCYCCHEFCPEKAIELRRTGLGRILPG